ncbi:hypothetical protein Tco_0654920 [Tanacetum coccineum]|uniref:Uncharacterized protein n=1 Tax=Tanacetum coccineum TaxID=301880 RepID=A0ABQ4X5N8_9ASTR
MNYMQQPMQNLEDSLDPITAMNMALDLIAKAFKVNTIPTNNNQRCYFIKSRVANQNPNWNGNVVAAPAKGNGNGINVAAADCSRGRSRDPKHSRAYNDMQQKTERLQAQLEYLKGKNSDTQCASNTLDPVSQKLEDENLVNNTAKTRRPHPRSNSNTNSVPSKSKSSFTANHDVCVLNYVNDMNSLADNQSANVTIRENQNKYKANAKNSKELGSKGSLALSRPSKPRTYLRWIPTGRIFAMCGKLTTSSNIENKSEKSVCDKASTSNPSKPSSKGFSNSASLLGKLSRLRKQHTSIYPIAVL